MKTAERDRRQEKNHRLRQDNIILKRELDEARLRVEVITGALQYALAHPLRIFWKRLTKPFWLRFGKSGNRPTDG